MPESFTAAMRRTPGKGAGVWALAAAMMGCALLSGGCGYTMSSSLDKQYQTIFVSAFENRTREYDLQAPLTTAMVRKFNHDGRLHVTTRDRADLVLEGAVTDYQLRGLTFDEQDNVTQYICVVTAAARLLDARTGEVIWDAPYMAGETSFYTRAPGQSTDRLRGNAETFLPNVRSFSSEEENRGASEALEQLASDIFYRTIEPW